MLVLSRKVGEEIRIDDLIRVTVVKIQGSRVRLGVEAPQDVAIVRGELDEEPQVPAACFELACSQPAGAGLGR